MSAPVPSSVYAEKPGLIKRFPYGVVSLILGTTQAIAWAVIFSRHDLFDVIFSSDRLNVAEGLLLWLPAVLAVILGVVGLILGRKPRQPHVAPMLGADNRWYVPVEPQVGMANDQKLAVAGLSIGASLLAIGAAVIAAIGLIIVAVVLFLIWLVTNSGYHVSG